MRILPPLAALALLLAALAPSAAAADEVFVLDNGEVLRGYVVRESEDVLQVRLTGFAQEARVSIPRTRIVRRFLSLERTERHPVQPPRSADDPDEVAATASAAQPDPPLAAEGPTDVAEPTAQNRWVHELPPEEPDAEEEGFFHRLARRVVQSIPADSSGRTILGLLLFVALLALVDLGCRVAEVDGMNLARTTALAALLGSFLVLDVWLHREVLRADRAVWVLPLQGAAWLGCAMALLRCGAGRTVMLFAFVLFCMALTVFAAGAILVSY